MSSPCSPASICTTPCICTDTCSGARASRPGAAAKALGAGIAMIALAGVGIGIGQIFSTLVSSIARNPSARSQVFGIGILGFALTEAVALYALVIAFIILFV